MTLAVGTTPTDSGATRRLTGAVGAVVALVVANVALRAAGTSVWPQNWDIDIYNPVRDVQSWVQRNRNSNWVFTGVLRPIGDGVLWLYDNLVDVLLWLPTWVLPVAAAAIVARSGRWGSAVLCALSIRYIDQVGLWEDGMETLALMLVCIAACVAIGFPVGVWAGVRPAVLRRISPILDALQAIPATVYFVPAVLLFGIKQVPAAIATVLFGIAPIIRITALGIQGVPEASVEAGTTFGSTPWQLLRKVRLPQAREAILTGVNQTINMNLGMVVIGALVGAGGLGGKILESMKLRSPGKGFIAGMAIVLLALVLDRVCRALASRQPLTMPLSRYIPLVAAGAVAGAAVLWLIGRQSTVDWIDESIISFRDANASLLNSMSDFFVRQIYVRGRDLLTNTIAWPVLVAGAAALAWWARGWKLAVFTVCGLALIGATGTWKESIDTFTQIIIAVIVAAVIAFPIGLLVSRSRIVESVVGPVLDFLQTLPSMVYAIPFVMFFRVGAAPGLLATVLYALPPGIRLVALALRGVDHSAIEASRTFGATPTQTLFGVRVPLAVPGLALALNQVIMMSLSMIIITGQIGGGALGYKAVSALTKPDIGEGAQLAVAMLVMAIVLDRTTQGAAARLSPAATAQRGAR